MKSRYIYSVLFGVPGFIVALIVSFILSGFAAGILWLYVFGDNPWPAASQSILIALFALVFLAVWLSFLITGFVVGKRLEQNPVLNKSHMLTWIGVTIIAILFILFYQLSVGNLGPRSEGEHCMNYCIQEGYSASSMPPRDSGERTCSCLDGSGQEIITVPIDSLDTIK